MRLSTISFMTRPLQLIHNCSFRRMFIKQISIKYFNSFRDPNKNPDGTYTLDTWPPYDANTMTYMNLTVESQYNEGAGRTGHGPRRKQCMFWKTLIPNILSASGKATVFTTNNNSLADVGESFIRWKQQMDRWENEYINDWQFHFEQYKRYQSYRHLDADDNGQCGN